jgi:hypothetical protein
VTFPQHISGTRLCCAVADTSIELCQLPSAAAAHFAMFSGSNRNSFGGDRLRMVLVSSPRLSIGQRSRNPAQMRSLSCACSTIGQTILSTQRLSGGGVLASLSSKPPPGLGFHLRGAILFLNKASLHLGSMSRLELHDDLVIAKDGNIQQHCNAAIAPPPVRDPGVMLRSPNCAASQGLKHRDSHRNCSVCISYAYRAEVDQGALHP